MRLRFSLIISAVIFLSVSGCAPGPNNQDLSSANQTLLKYCREYGYDVSIDQIGRTLWLYLPIKEDIIALEATREGPKKSDESAPAFDVKYLDAVFENNNFVISFDIQKTFEYEKSYGYNSVYTQTYQEIQNNLLAVIKQAYFDVPKSQAPEFIVFVVADIESGIEVENMLYFDDFKKAMSTPPTFTQEEYGKRFISELRGNQAVIGDAKGAHLERHAVTFEEFLAAQMVNRINFKFQRSIFPPSDDIREEVLAQVKETLRAYEFRNFNKVILKNLRKDTTEEISASAL